MIKQTQIVKKKKEEERKRNEEVEKKIEELEFKRHIFLLVLGIIMIIISLVINKSQIGAGLNVGGVLMLIYGAFTYWDKYNDKARLDITALGLVVTIYLASRMIAG